MINQIWCINDRIFIPQNDKSNILYTNAFGAIVTLYLSLPVNIAKNKLSRYVICVLKFRLGKYSFVLRNIVFKWYQNILKGIRVYEAIANGPNKLG